MKKIKMTNPLPTAAGGMGAIAGAVMGAGDAGSPAHMAINAAVFGTASLVGGALLARKEKIERQENPELRNKNQLGKYGEK